MVVVRVTLPVWDGCDGVTRLMGVLLLCADISVEVAEEGAEEGSWESGVGVDDSG